MSDQADLRKAGEDALKKLREDAKANAEVTSTEPRKDLTPEEAEIRASERATKKARYAQVLTRGILNEKLALAYNLSVPEGYAGKFVRDTEGDVIRYSNLGYGFTYREGAKGLNASPDGRVRVGDVVLMTITREDIEILREIQSDRIKYKVGEQGRQEYTREAERAAEGGKGPVPFDESSTTISR
jgi:hypothetical protein